MNRPLTARKFMIAGATYVERQNFRVIEAGNPRKKIKPQIVNTGSRFERVYSGPVLPLRPGRQRKERQRLRADLVMVRLDTPHGTVTVPSYMTRILELRDLTLANLALAHGAAIQAEQPAGIAEIQFTFADGYRCKIGFRDDAGSVEEGFYCEEVPGE